MPVTAIARRASGDWLTITKSGLAFWDPGSNRFSLITDPLKDKPDFSFNDGAVDRQGRFLLGSYNNKELGAAEGSLYRMDGDATLHELDTGMKAPNGIGLSPDGNKLYVTEMFNYKIHVYDYDTKEGTVSNRATFADIPESAGMPDGLTVDSQGFVWSAHWKGSRVTRYNPEGKIDMAIKVPAEIVSCIGFGGENMDELFITTAWYGFDKEKRAKQPQAGDLFRVKTGIKGLVEPEFIG